jgi:hypothetical protein
VIDDLTSTDAALIAASLSDPAALAQAPAPSGDATLVHRFHHLKAGHDFAGVDLYLDDGRYFYGMTDADLRADAGSGDDMSEGTTRREIAAAHAGGGRAGEQGAREEAARGAPRQPVVAR